MPSLNALESCFYQVLGDLRNFLPSLTLVGGWARRSSGSRPATIRDGGRNRVEFYGDIRKPEHGLAGATVARSPKKLDMISPE